MIDEIISSGKKALLILGLAGLLGCAVTYAKRDYDQYPAYKKDIALYNMKEIASDFCDPSNIIRFPACKKIEFDNSGFTYTRTNCYRWNGRGGCNQSQLEQFSMAWSEIRKIIPVPEDGRLQVFSENDQCITLELFNGQRQLADFAEAMNIYLQEK